MGRFNPSLESITSKIVKAGAVEIHNFERGEEPFVYTTGNRGPGYAMIKGLVGQPEVMCYLVKALAIKVENEAEFDFINGNVTGGTIPGWELSRVLSLRRKKTVPYTYMRGSRKVGGHGELVTGLKNNPLIEVGMKALIVEELVNFAETTTNAGIIFREMGYPVSHGACILAYDHKEEKRLLKEAKMTLVSLITLPQLLDASQATGLFPKDDIDSYRTFLKDPITWQLDRGMVIPEKGVPVAESRGYTMARLDPKEAIKQGAPEGKVNEGIAYYAVVNSAPVK